MLPIHRSPSPAVTLTGTGQWRSSCTGTVQRATDGAAPSQHGELTQSQVFNYGNLSTPARTYNNTLTDTNYTSRDIYNRLLLSTGC
jgi:hypothetical protein